MSIRTDLAIESARYAGDGLKGVAIDEFEAAHGIKITRVEVENDEGSNAIGKPIGKYITVECSEVYDRPVSERKEFAMLAANEITDIINDGPVLVVGLGNRYITPDSLGPRVCDKIFITRHIKEYIPEAIDERAGTICAIAPGVLGVTGLETGEVVKGITDNVKPSCIIAIDALAAGSTSRIGTSIQISDTGINPGSGVGNMRKSLTLETLGVPVIAIGVPTVVYARTIAAEMMSDAPNLFNRLARSDGADLIVTPKNIDTIIEKDAQLIADILNLSLHRNLTDNEIMEYMQ